VQPSSAWRSAERSRPPTSTIGVIIPGHSPFFGPFLAGIERGSPDAGLSFVCDARENPERGRRFVDQLVAKGADGIIVAGPMVPLDVITQHLDRGPPIVTADNPGAPGTGVDLDLWAAGAAAAEHLMGHGHRRIGIIAPPVILTNVAPRVDGFRGALLDAGLVPEPELVAEVGDWSTDAGSIGAEALLGLGEPPTAVVTAADTLAAGFLRVARSRGVSVPNDLALVSIDDSAAAGFTDPPLTSVHLSAYDLGQRAAEALARLRAGEPVSHERQTLPVDLVIRQSCGCQES
jgi:LacI family transcriptional regulator